MESPSSSKIDRTSSDRTFHQKPITHNDENSPHLPACLNNVSKAFELANLSNKSCFIVEYFHLPVYLYVVQTGLNVAANQIHLNSN